MKRFSPCAALLAVCTLFPFAANAVSVTLIPTADSFVSSANTTANYGGAGAITVSAAGLPNGEFRSLLKFDLSTAMSSFDSTYGAGQWTVQSISLQLTATPPNNAVFNSPSAAGSLLISWMQNDSWTEGTGTPGSPTTTGITWSTLPSLLSGSDQTLGTLSYNGATSGAFTSSLSLVSGLVGDTTAGQLASMLLVANDSTVSGVFNSRSFGTASSRPMLTITAVPEPGSAVLLFIGGLLTARCLRRSPESERGR
jgi:hypothetical protein